MTCHMSDPLIWTLPLFRTLSQNAKLTYHALVTNPLRKRIPGLQVIGPAALAEIMGSSVEELGSAFTELIQSGLLQYDYEALVARLPGDPKVKAKYCQNPSILLRWWADWQEISDVDMRYEHIASIASGIAFHKATTNFLCVWWGTFGSTYAAWYWRKHGKLSAEPWANQPDGWQEYCKRKGAHPDELLGVNTASWKTATLALRQSTPCQVSHRTRKPSPALNVSAATSNLTADSTSLLLSTTLSTGEASTTEINLSGSDHSDLSTLEEERSENVDLSGRAKTLQVDPTGKDLMQGRERREQRSHRVLERRPNIETGETNGPLNRRGRTKPPVAQPSDLIRKHRVSSSSIGDRRTARSSALGVVRGFDFRTERSSEPDLATLRDPAPNYDWIDALCEAG